MALRNGNKVKREDESSSSKSSIPKDVQLVHAGIAAKEISSLSPKPVSEESSISSSFESVVEDTAKHKPVAPKGTNFSWEANKHLDNGPLMKPKTEEQKREQKKKLRFLVIATNGKKYSYNYRRKVDWTNNKSITRANNWRNQIFLRTLNKPGNISTKRRPPRLTWSVRERDFAAANIEKKLRSRGKKLTGEDWDQIAKAQNQKSKGKKLIKGEQMAQSKTNKGGLSKGGKSEKERAIPERSATSLRTMVKKWQDVDDMVKRVLAEVDDVVASGGDGEDEDEDGGEEGESEDESSGTEVDADLEEESDDDHDGNRPAKDATGGIPVAVA